MISKLFTATLIGITLTATGFAQDSTQSKRIEKKIIVRQNGDKTEKMTVVVDGDKVTINGKPVDNFKDDDLEMFKDKKTNIEIIAPHARMNGDHKVFSGDFIVSETNKAFLGVLTEKDEKGAKIISVTKGSSAEKSGLQKNDIITKVADTKIENGDDLYKAIGKYKPEDKVAITYLRDGKTNTVTATLGKSNTEKTFKIDGGDNFNFHMPDMNFGPDTKHFNFAYSSKPRLGVQIQDLEEGNGVKIIEVDDESVAEKAGLKENDVIVDVDGKEIKNVDDLKTKIKDIKEGDSFKIKYKREGKIQTADVKFPKKLKTANL